MSRRHHLLLCLKKFVNCDIYFYENKQIKRINFNTNTIHTGAEFIVDRWGILLSIEDMIRAVLFIKYDTFVSTKGLF